MDHKYASQANIRPLSPVQYLESQVYYLRYLATHYSPFSTQRSVQTVKKKPEILEIDLDFSEKSEIFTEKVEKISKKPENFTEKWKINPHDEIPVKALSEPYEKVTEKEPKFFDKLKRKNSSKPKQSFLKRKSQKVVPNKETTPNIRTSQSKLATYLNSNKNCDDFLECDEKSKEDIIQFPAERVKYSLIHKKNLDEKSSTSSVSPKKLSSAKSARTLNMFHKSQGAFNTSRQPNLPHKNLAASSSPRTMKSSVKSLNQAQAYNKKIKEVEEKIKKVEVDTMKFTKMRESELKSLKNIKSETAKRLLTEQKSLESLQKKFSSPNLSSLRQEVRDLSHQISANEEFHNKEIERLKDFIETLSQQNSELLKKMYERGQEYLDSKSLQNLSEISADNKILIPDQHPTKNMNVKPDCIPTFTLNLPSPKNSLKTGLNKENKPKESEKKYEDGKREIYFSNGVKKEVFPDGFILVNFKNKDKKELFPDGRTVYHFFETDTVQTTYPDGLLVLEFPNGQIEKHFVDGSKEIKFADGTLKCIFADGQEESVYPNGTLEKVNKDGVRIVEYANGIKDTFLVDGSKVRVLADGSVKKYVKGEVMGN